MDAHGHRHGERLMLNLPGQRSCPWEGEREGTGQSGSVSLEEWDLLSKKHGEYDEKLEDRCPLSKEKWDCINGCINNTQRKCPFPY